MRDIPSLILRIQGQIRLPYASPLQSSRLDRPICHTPLEMIGTSPNREICKTDFKRVATCNRWASYTNTINNRGSHDSKQRNMEKTYRSNTPQ